MRPASSRAALARAGLFEPLERGGHGDAHERDRQRDDEERLDDGVPAGAADPDGRPAGGAIPPAAAAGDHQSGAPVFSARGAPTVRQSLILRKPFSPMPCTFMSSSIFLKAPFFWR